LNPRTPTGLAPQASALDLAWLPPHPIFLLRGYIFFPAPHSFSTSFSNSLHFSSKISTAWRKSCSGLREP
jgi:hypothetical protein